MQMIVKLVAYNNYLINVKNGDLGSQLTQAISLHYPQLMLEVKYIANV